MRLFLLNLHYPYCNACVLFKRIRINVDNAIRGKVLVLTLEKSMSICVVFSDHSYPRQHKMY